MKKVNLNNDLERVWFGSAESENKRWIPSLILIVLVLEKQHKKSSRRQSFACKNGPC